MGCASCGRSGGASETLKALAARANVQSSDRDTLSAAVITRAGWVATCVVCGAKTEPVRFPEQVEKSCKCTFRQA